jgi:hypothetical protein
MTQYSTPPPPYTRYTCTQYAYSQMEGGSLPDELTREKVRGAIVNKVGRKFQQDWLYLQSVISTKHQ